MKVLFLTADLGGNVPPTLAVAEALARRGIEVEIAGLPAGRTALEQVPFAPATAIRPREGKQGPSQLGALMRLMTSRKTSERVRALIAERRADVVAVDCMTPAPIRGAVESGVPVVVLFHTLGSYWMRSFDRGPMGATLGMLGLRPRTLWTRAAARLLLTDPELDPSSEDPALTDYAWTGTTEIGSEPLVRSGRPRVLVALSSSDWPGMLPVYRRIIAALSGMGVDAVVTTGGVDLGGDLPGTANVEVRGWVPHAELLPTVDLLIGHGGHSTTMKALAHGVPLLVLPINPTADQHLIGRVVEAAGLGRRLPKSARPAAIREAVQAILADDELRALAAATGRRLRSLTPGAEVAADRILAVSS